MKIVTTPMCENILKLAGVNKYMVSINPDSTDSDMAVVLSETDTSMRSIKIKLNTHQQIIQSIDLIRDTFGISGLEPVSIGHIFERSKIENQKIKVKVYSNFLKDILVDMGFNIVVGDEDHSYLVYPDYIKDEILDEVTSMGERAVEIPSHKNCPKDPIERAEQRYKLLEKKLCMKH